MAGAAIKKRPHRGASISGEGCARRKNRADCAFLAKGEGGMEGSGGRHDFAIILANHCGAVHRESACQREEVKPGNQFVKAFI